MEQSTGQYAGRICERCLMRKLQCSVKAGMWSCSQCKRSKVGCVFGWVIDEEEDEDEYADKEEAKFLECLKNIAGTPVGEVGGHIQ